MFKDIKNIIIVALFCVIGVLLLLRECNPPKPREVFLKGKDSLYIDTIPAPYKVVEFKTKWYPKSDTVLVDSSKWNLDLCKFERSYSDSTSNDSITIYSSIKTIGILKSSKLSYRWKVPTVEKHTFRTDTLVRPSKVSLYTGLELSGNQISFNASPYLSLNYKRTNIGVSYGLLNKSVGVRVGFRLFKSRR